VGQTGGRTARHADHSSHGPASQHDGQPLGPSRTTSSSGRCSANRCAGSPPMAIRSRTRKSSLRISDACAQWCSDGRISVRGAGEHRSRRATDAGGDRQLRQAARRHEQSRAEAAIHVRVDLGRRRQHGRCQRYWTKRWRRRWKALDALRRLDRSVACWPSCCTRTS
jgi:hypothetical protein